MVDGHHGSARQRTVQQAVGAVGGRQVRFEVRGPSVVAAARLPDVFPPGGPGRGCSGRRGRSPRCRVVMRSWEPPRRAAGPVQNTMRGTGAEPVTVFSRSVRAGDRTCGPLPPGANCGHTPSPSRQRRWRRQARRPPARREGRPAPARPPAASTEGSRQALTTTTRSGPRCRIHHPLPSRDRRRFRPQTGTDIRAEPGRAQRLFLSWGQPKTLWVCRRRPDRRHPPREGSKNCDRMQLLPYPIRERPRMRSSPCRPCYLWPTGSDGSDHLKENSHAPQTSRISPPRASVTPPGPRPSDPIWQTPHSRSAADPPPRPQPAARPATARRPRRQGGAR